MISMLVDNKRTRKSWCAHECWR